MAISERVVLQFGVIEVVPALIDQPPSALEINEHEMPMWLYYSQFCQTYSVMRPLLDAYVAQYGSLSRHEEGLLCNGLARVCQSPPSFRHLRPTSLYAAEKFLEMGCQYIRDHNDEQMEKKGMTDGNFIFLWPHGRTVDTALGIVERSWIVQSGMWTTDTT